MFSNTGRALTTNQKISSFKIADGKYQVVFTTSDFEGEDGYVYFSIRLDKTLTEDTTVYLDNLNVKECKTHVNENFDDVTELNDQIAKGANSTVAVENGALKATCTSGKQGFLGVYVKVEAGKTYIVNFDATVKGADGTDYSAGTKGGDSATVMVYQNAFNDNNSRLTFMASKANASVNNTPLVNTLNTAVPNYSLTFTATEDGYVYIALRTNNIAQESYITIDNLVVSELPKN
jgi:3-deoxy-D-manno-octulosonic-acid transferase